MTSITLNQAHEAAEQLNRDIYALINKRLQTFEEETGMHPYAIEISMAPFRASFELDTVHCKVQLS